MTLSAILSVVVALCLSCGVVGFVVAPPPATARCCRHSAALDASPRSHMIRRTRAATSTGLMMGGFGAKPKETPPASGAGKGQKAYERQMKSFNGLREAGAEGKDVYVHRLADGDDKFVFAGKLAWSSGVTVEQALQWQKTLVLDHVKVLEPLWKTKKLAPMRIYTAPLNSEVEVARNIHDLVWVLGGKGKGADAINTDSMSSPEVGFMPELYEEGEDYYYVRKDIDGKSLAPPAEVMIESMEKMVEAGVLPAAGGADGAAAPPAAQ